MPSKRASLSILLLAIAPLLPRVGAAQTTNQCTCPSIAADGFGSSACSANESAKRCRVEFNQFTDESLDRARAALERGGARIAATPPRGDDVARELARLPEAERVDVLTIYLAVAASRDRDYDAEQAKGLYATVNRDRETRRRIAEAFDERALPSAEPRGRDEGSRAAPRPYGDRSPRASRGDGVVTSRGCVAVQVGPDWYLYKAAWSPASTLPQCAQE